LQQLIINTIPVLNSHQFTDINISEGWQDISR